MTIEPKISKYIDTTVDRAVERKIGAFDKNIKTYFKTYADELNKKNEQHIDKLNGESDRRMDKLIEESKRHMGALKEFFQDEVKIVAEVAQERPTRDEVREIFRDEFEAGLRPINAKLDFLNEERHAMLDAIADIKA